MKHLFWNTRVLEIFSFIWLLSGLIFFTSLALGEKNKIPIKNPYDKNISLYRNDTLYLVNNDLGKLVSSIWESDTVTVKRRPTVILVEVLPKDLNK